MSQHDLTIANQGFPAFRADLNDALQALGSCQSGTSAPSPTFANQLWYDTTNNILKIRNEDNDAWISIATLDQTTDTLTAIGSVNLADIITAAGTNTLTNKTLTNPVINGFTGNTEVINVGSGQFYKSSGGNIGIGTTTPSGKLDVTQNLNSSLFRHSIGTYLKIETQAVNGRIKLWADANNGDYPPFDFNAGGSTRFTIETNGQQESTIVGSSGTYNEYKCRAWVNFNGSGTVAIRASGNVSSITDNGTGNYTVNLTTALPNANYAVNATGQRLTTGDPEAIRILGAQELAVGSFKCTCNGSSGVPADAEIISCSIFR